MAEIETPEKDSMMGAPIDDSRFEREWGSYEALAPKPARALAEALFMALWKEKRDAG